MGTLAIVLYLVAAVINLLPVSGLFGPALLGAAAINRWGLA
jgi:hypothetical protein